MTDNIRHLTKDLEAYAIEQYRVGPSKGAVSAASKPTITVNTDALSFTCKDPDFDVNLRDAERGQEHVVHEDSFRNDTDREIVHTFPVEVKKSYKATFDWHRSLVLPESETIRLPPQLQFNDVTSIKLGTNSGENFTFETSTMENVEVRIKPYEAVKIEVRKEEVKYDSKFSVKIVPSHKTQERGIVLAYVQNGGYGGGASPVTGSITEVFTELSKGYPGYTKKGAFKAEGHCSMTKVIKHRHTVTRI